MMRDEVNRCKHIQTLPSQSNYKIITAPSVLQNRKPRLLRSDWLGTGRLVWNKQNRAGARQLTVLRRWHRRCISTGTTHHTSTQYVEKGERRKCSEQDSEFLDQTVTSPSAGDTGLFPVGLLKFLPCSTALTSHRLLSNQNCGTSFTPFSFYLAHFFTCRAGGFWVRFHPGPPSQERHTVLKHW